MLLVKQRLRLKSCVIKGLVKIASHKNNQHSLSPHNFASTMIRKALGPVELDVFNHQNRIGI